MLEIIGFFERYRLDVLTAYFNLSRPYLIAEATCSQANMFLRK
jgi:hypothetical protein